MRILVSAAEISSDLHAARVLAELRRVLALKGEPVEAFGIGGPRLRAEGLDALSSAESLLAMGSTEALGKLPLLRKARRRLLDRCARQRPDAALVVDYPEFHTRLARDLQRMGIPVFCYIPPKVWVWRRHRARLLAQLYREVLCILPFEEEYLARHGVNARYVGNPLAESLPWSLDRGEARRALGIPADAEVMAVLPGSRPSELALHMPILAGAAALLSRRPEFAGRSPSFVVAMPESLPAGGRNEVEWESLFCSEFEDCGGAGAKEAIRFVRGRSHEVMVAADAGWVKSGTSTLEAGALGLPHAVLYRGSRLTEWVFTHFVRRSFQGPVGLVNLFTGWRPGDALRVREYLGGAATPSALAEEGARLLRDPAERIRQKEEFRILAERVRGGRDRTPSQEVVQSLLAATGSRADHL